MIYLKAFSFIQLSYRKSLRVSTLPQHRKHRFPKQAILCNVLPHWVPSRLIDTTALHCVHSVAPVELPSLPPNCPSEEPQLLLRLILNCRDVLTGTLRFLCLLDPIKVTQQHSWNGMSPTDIYKDIELPHAVALLQHWLFLCRSMCPQAAALGTLWGLTANQQETVLSVSCSQPNPLAGSLLQTALHLLCDGCILHNSHLPEVLCSSCSCRTQARDPGLEADGSAH